MKYLLIPDHGYNSKSLEKLLIAIHELEDERGLRVLIEPRTVWFMEGPFRPEHLFTEVVRILNK